MRSRTPRLLLIVAITAGAALVTPYLGLDIDKSRLPVGGPAHYAVLVVHIFTAAVALVAGPLQFAPPVRRNLTSALRTSLIIFEVTDQRGSAVHRWRSTVLLAAALGLVPGVSACGATDATSPGSTGGAGGGSSRTIRVVAAENFWGSIAAQVGGPHVQVSSIIDNPDADPHDYEPTAADGRAIATADLVLVNGIGYDTWASKLAAANPAQNRTMLDVGRLVGVPGGGNPHRWYDPDDVSKVADQLAADFAEADPADAAAFRQQRRTFQTQALAGYTKVIADIRRRFAGTAVGASESIFALVVPALGLDLVTPPSFLKAVSEGSDPTAADKSTIDRQISRKQVKVYVYNAQNATPDVQGQVDAARAAGIPVTTITETMVPATATWQDWQTRQLEGLRDALAKATGK